MNEMWWVKPEDLDDDQRQVISLPLEGNHLVEGPPGSGKTNLLLLRANYLVLAGQPDVRILLFSRNLREFIATGADHYSFSADKVSTLRQWQTAILRAHGKNIKFSGTFDEQRQYLLKKTRDLVVSAGIGQLCDILLLDESQDYLPEEIELFRGFCNHFFAVADIQQKIYGGESPLGVLRSLADNTSLLRFHYRNGLKICAVADALGSSSNAFIPMTPTSNYDESANPSSVTVYKTDSLDEQAEKIILALDTQRKAFPNELLGVIVPRHAELNKIWSRIALSKHSSSAVLQTADDGYTPFDEEHHICVCTIHSAKGLEFRAVHIPSCEMIKKFRTQRKLAFTAVTRAKTSLSIYHTKPLPGYLEDAVSRLEPKPGLPPLQDVF